jgi:hypothetical protein
MISKLHVTFAIFTYYVIPLVITVSIYIYIFYKVKQAKKNATTITNSLNSQKRDLQLLRNVLIYISVYLLGGFPSLVFYMTHKKLPYFINLVTVPATVAISKFTITLLDREIHLVIKSILCRTQTTPVKPFDNRFITKRTQINTNHLQIHVTS